MKSVIIDLIRQHVALEPNSLVILIEIVEVSTGVVVEVAIVDFQQLNKRIEWLCKVDQMIIIMRHLFGSISNTYRLD